MEKAARNMKYKNGRFEDLDLLILIKYSAL